jgi:putative endonuclease
MNKRQTGTAYEEKAALWLESKGMKVMERNFRCRQGEIDLIAQDGKYLVFVEVKYRSADKVGYPAEAVNFRKQKRIADASAYYCYKHKVSENQPCRYDVISILGEEITHIENAFEYR